MFDSYTDGINKLNLTKYGFKEEYVIILFSKTTCQSCDIMKPSFKDCEEFFKANGVNNIRFITLDCDIESEYCKYEELPFLIDSIKKNKKLSQRREIITFPTIVSYVKKHDSQSWEYKWEYNGDRSYNSFVSFAENLISDDIALDNLSSKISNIFPVKNNHSKKIYDLYLNARNCFWIEKELDLSKDKTDWNTKLSKDEQFFLENILAFFAQSDQIVNVNLEERFMKDVDNLPSDLNIYVKLFYNFQKMMEDIHSITYETLLETYISDSVKKNNLKNAIETIPAIKKKAAWAAKWIESDKASFGTRLIAFAILEGVFFSGSFCAIFWIRERGILNGLTKSNEFISRDEGLHYMFALELFNILREKGDVSIGEDCSNEMILEILEEAVSIEKEFITSSFNCRLIGMNSDEMKNYIEFVADILLSNIGFPKHYNTKNPFMFMENIGLQNKTNFFEQRVSDYKKSNSSDNANVKLSLDEDF
jgi:ribonucleotide reductase beta subunit family protein with ferritin-like domain/thiol-disulfide isomerase/thioredoxin